jgi:hypothetical protein
VYGVLIEFTMKTLVAIIALVFACCSRCAIGASSVVKPDSSDQSDEAAIARQMELLSESMTRSAAKLGLNIDEEFSPFVVSLPLALRVLKWERNSCHMDAALGLMLHNPSVLQSLFAFRGEAVDAAVRSGRDIFGSPYPFGPVAVPEFTAAAKEVAGTFQSFFELILSPTSDPITPAELRPLRAMFEKHRFSKCLSMYESNSPFETFCLLSEFTPFGGSDTPLIVTVYHGDLMHDSVVECLALEHCEYAFKNGMPTCLIVSITRVGAKKGEGIMAEDVPQKKTPLVVTLGDISYVLAAVMSGWRNGGGGHYWYSRMFYDKNKMRCVRYDGMTQNFPMPLEREDMDGDLSPRDGDMAVYVQAKPGGVDTVKEALFSQLAPQTLALLHAAELLQDDGRIAAGQVLGRVLNFAHTINDRMQLVDRMEDFVGLVHTALMEYAMAMNGQAVREYMGLFA